MRSTKEDVRGLFDDFARACGRKTTPWRTVKGKLTGVIGAWHLDYAPEYGGYVIEETVNVDGGVRRPFGEKRMASGVFFRAMQFALWSPLNRKPRRGSRRGKK